MFQKVKGTIDYLPKMAARFNELEQYLLSVVSLYGFKEIRVPILTDSSLIHRSVGETSDIVTKETFDFLDRGDRQLSLRPEGTAPVMRAVIENKMYADALPLKLCYIGDMFRYERPQKGRYREFSQFGCEIIGQSNPYLDGELISMVNAILSSLQIGEYKIKINTLGDKESKEAYKNALVEYLRPNIDSLCGDCKKRFETNPLRILDCKVDSDSDILKNAPKISSYLSEKSKAEFECVKAYLDQLEIPYEVSDSLVRGLDYYTSTVFEIESTKDGESLVICGGGRYDSLMKELDGPDMGAVGFAFGLERLLSFIEDKSKEKGVICQLIPLGLTAKAYMVSLMQDLRLTGFSCAMDYEAQSLKGHFKSCDRNNPKFILIMGDDEIAKEEVTVKNKINNTEEKVPLAHLKQHLIAGLRCSHNCSSCNEGC